jgi:mRNA interferase RelE/StbE
VNYRVEVLPKAAEAIRRLDAAVSHRILLRIKWLSANLDIIKHQMLAGKFRGMYKNRIGDYRIIYSIDKVNGIIFVHRAGHRSDIYE